MGQGPGVSTVWCTWKTVRKVAQHEPRLHFWEEQEVRLGDDVGLQSLAMGEGREGQKRTVAL